MSVSMRSRPLCEPMGSTPFLVILMPLYCFGLWLAVTMRVEYFWESQYVMGVVQ